MCGARHRACECADTEFTSSDTRSARISPMHGAAATGHSGVWWGTENLATTQRYMHLSPGAADRTIRLLERGDRCSPDGDILETAAAGETKVNG